MTFLTVTNFELRSPRKTIRKGLFLSSLPKLSLRLSENVSNSFRDWSGDLYREIKLHLSFQFSLQSLITHEENEYLICRVLRDLVPNA